MEETMRLPVCADKRPARVNDVLVDSYGKLVKVIGVSKNGVFYKEMDELGCNRVKQLSANSLRHVADTPAILAAEIRKLAKADIVNDFGSMAAFNAVLQDIANRVDGLRS